MNHDRVRPMCAVCKRPVDQAMVEENVMTRETIYTVRCHGESESAVLTDVMLIEADRITFGEAFATKRLAGS